METRPCEQCGKPVTRFPCKFKKYKHVYCSPECCNEWRKGRPRPDHGPKVRKALKGRKPSPQCRAAVSKANTKRLKDPEIQAMMQAALEDKRQDSKWADEYGKKISAGLNRYYETHDGPNLGRFLPQTKEHKANLSKALTGPRFIVQCAWCNADVELHPCKYKENKSRFCNRQCHLNWLASKYNGENHPLWRGGHSRWRGTNWAKQASRARCRDKYTCQACGLTQDESLEQWNRRLDVHHVIPFATFDDWKEANRLINLITLCVACHKAIENDMLLSERNEHIDKHQS